MRRGTRGAEERARARAHQQVEDCAPPARARRAVRCGAVRGRAGGVGAHRLAQEATMIARCVRARRHEAPRGDARAAPRTGRRRGRRCARRPSRLRAHRKACLPFRPSWSTRARPRPWPPWRWPAPPARRTCAGRAGGRRPDGRVAARAADAPPPPPAQPAPVRSGGAAAPPRAAPRAKTARPHALGIKLSRVRTRHRRWDEHHRGKSKDFCARTGGGDASSAARFRLWLALLRALSFTTPQRQHLCSGKAENAWHNARAIYSASELAAFP